MVFSPGGTAWTGRAKAESQPTGQDPLVNDLVRSGLYPTKQA
jgi:hypothetical protein